MPRTSPEVDSEPNEQSPVLKKPDNPEWVNLLKRKAEDYTRRLDTSKSPFDYENSQTGYALRIMKELLEKGEVKTFDLSQELFSQQNEHFNLARFEMACSVVDRYITDRAFLEDHL